VKYLADFNPALTTGAFVRLVILVVVMMSTGLVFTSLILWFYVNEGVSIPPGWKIYHAHFSDIQSLPNSELSKQLVQENIFMWWMPPASGVFFFCFFSFTEDVRKDYRTVISWFCRVILRRQIEEPKRSLLGLYVNL
jgi:hypothetical protein